MGREYGQLMTIAWCGNEAMVRGWVKSRPSVRTRAVKREMSVPSEEANRNRARRNTHLEQLIRSSSTADVNTETDSQEAL